MLNISPCWILSLVSLLPFSSFAQAQGASNGMKVAYSLVIKAPQNEAKSPAQCSLQYKGNVLARSTVLGTDSYAFSGAFVIDKGVRAVQLVCQKKGFDVLRETVALVENSLKVESSFRDPSLFQSPKVNPEQGSAEVRLIIPVFQKLKLTIAGKSFYQLGSSNEEIFFNSYNGKAMLPEFPQASFLLALPLDAEIADIRVKPGQILAEEPGLLAPHPFEGVADPVKPVEPQFQEKTYFSVKPILSMQKDFAFQLIKSGKQNFVRITIPLLDFDSQKAQLRFYRDATVSVRFKSSSTCFQKPIEGQDPVDQLRSQQLVGLSQQALNPTDLLLPCQSDGRTGVWIDPTPRLLRANILNLAGPNFVIVASPEFLGVAEEFRQHKESLGIRTAVLPWEGGSAESLKLRLQVLNSASSLQWVLLLGDVDRIPSYYDRDSGDSGYGDHALNAGDIFYTQYPTGDVKYSTALDPSFGIGRIPAHTVDEVKASLNRVMRFENAPPLLDSYYQSPTVTATLQIQANSDTGNADNYADFMEQLVAQPYLQNGFRPERIYRADTELAKSPKFWAPATPLAPSPRPIDYASLTRSSPGLNPALLFHIDGSQDLIDKSIARGTGVLFNRGHASPEQWAYPNYTYDPNRFSLFSEQLPPIVFSLSCLTGFFDSETIHDSGNILGPESDFSRVPANQRSLAEDMLLDPHGALAVIAGSRMSHWTFNNRLTKGLARSVIYKQSTTGSKLSQHLGDILLDAKLAAKKVSSPVGSAQGLDQTNRHHLLIYNVLGDPSLELRTNAPTRVSSNPSVNYDAEVHSLRLRFRMQSTACPSCDLALQTEQPLVVLTDGQGNTIQRAVATTIRGEGGENREIVFSQVPVFYGALLKYTISGADLIPFRAVIDNRLQ